MSDSIAEDGVEETDEAVQEETVEEPESIPEPGTDEAEQADDQQPEEGEEEGKTEEEPEAEYEEIEFDFGGKKLAIGKNDNVEAVAGQLQDYAKSLEAGFTQKTQAVAEQRKSLETQTKAIQELSQLNEEAFNLYSKANAHQNEIAKFDQPNWQELWSTDPDKARELSDQRQFLQSELQNYQTAFQQKTQAMNQEQSTQRDRFMDEGRKQMENKIKGYESKAAEVVNYVVETYGIPRERAEEWPLNPAGAEMAYKAMMFDKMQSTMNTAKKPKIKPAGVMPPTKTSTRNTRKPLHEMSMGEYVKAREAGRFE